MNLYFHSVISERNVIWEFVYDGVYLVLLLNTISDVSAKQNADEKNTNTDKKTNIFNSFFILIILSVC